MFWDNVSFVISIALLAIIADGTALICVKETACSCHLPNGTFYDLNHLSAQGFVSLYSFINYYKTGSNRCQLI